LTSAHLNCQLDTWQSEMFVTKAPFESRVAKHVQSLIQPETDKEPVFHLEKKGSKLKAMSL